ncbi:MAG: sulfite exporter TauE/SafE family protein [Thermodesulfobacteriota bacterium]
MANPFLIGAVFLLAGFVQGMSGFGAALVAIPLLTLLIDIKVGVPLCILNSIVITTFLTLRLKKHLDRERILPLCLAAIPGVGLGTLLLKHAASASIQTAMGVLLCSYCIYSLFVRPGPQNLHRIWGYVAGFLTGAISAAFSTGGPPTIIYTALTGWKKDEIKATLTGFFLFNSCLTATVHVIGGITTVEVLGYFLITAPLTLLGTLFGSLYYDRISRQSYLTLIFTFLFLMGMMMIITA